MYMATYLWQRSCSNDAKAVLSILYLYKLGTCILQTPCQLQYNSVHVMWCAWLYAFAFSAKQFWNLRRWENVMCLHIELHTNIRRETLLLRYHLAWSHTSWQQQQPFQRIPASSCSMASTISPSSELEWESWRRLRLWEGLWDAQDEPRVQNLGCVKPVGSFQKCTLLSQIFVRHRFTLCVCIKRTIPIIMFRSFRSYREYLHRWYLHFTIHWQLQMSPVLWAWHRLPPW